MSGNTSFDVELDLTKAIRQTYHASENNGRYYHIFDKPLWQLLDILVPNFKRDSVPPFLKTAKLQVHLSHENIHLLKCCKERDEKPVAPGVVYRVIESNSSNSNRINEINQFKELKSLDKGTHKNKSIAVSCFSFFNCFLSFLLRYSFCFVFVFVLFCFVLFDCD